MSGDNSRYNALVNYSNGKLTEDPRKVVRTPATAAVVVRQPAAHTQPAPRHFGEYQEGQRMVYPIPETYGEYPPVQYSQPMPRGAGSMYVMYGYPERMSSTQLPVGRPAELPGGARAEVPEARDLFRPVGIVGDRRAQAHGVVQVPQGSGVPAMKENAEATMTDQEVAQPRNTQKPGRELRARNVGELMKKFSNLRTLTGRVARVREWMSYQLALPVVYIIHGRLLAAIQCVGPNKVGSRARSVSRKTFILVDTEDCAQKLRCVFYEIDHRLEILDSGTRVKVTGLGQADGSIQVLSLLQVQPQQEDPYLPRLENLAVRGIRLGLLAQKAGPQTDQAEEKENRPKTKRKFATSS